MNVISRDEATRLINKEEAVVVDVRSRDDYRKGHISGALNVATDGIKKAASASWKSIKLSP
nr:rhodanese-like domain-containing protein [Candidatus Pantoea persica]